MLPKRYLTTLMVLSLVLLPILVLAQVAAPTPTMLEGEVMSLYSDVYTDIAGSNFNPGWGQATVYTEEVLDGNNTILLTGLNYQGLNIGSADGGVGHDFSSMGYLHLDVWTANSTALNVFLISLGSGEQAYTVPLISEAWISLNIPLSHYIDLGMTMNDIHQLKFDGNGDIYLDNIYFVSGSATLVPAPSPTELEASVVSIYSDAYTDIAGSNYNPGWGQATVYTEEVLDGNNTILLTGLNYQGLNIGSADGGVANDFSNMAFLHLDVWSANSTALNVYMISLGTGEQAYAVPLASNTWISLNIPLSHYIDLGMTMNDIHQLKFDGDGDIYLDNIYLIGGSEAAGVTLAGFENVADVAIGAGEFWEPVVESEDGVNNYLNSTLITADGIPQDGAAAGQFNYSVAHDLGWGGYVSILHTADEYIDLSGNNYISFYLRNYLASSIDSSMSLRFTLMDGSELADPADWSKDSCEYFYSFIEADFIFDTPDTGWAEIRIPLVSTGLSSVVEYTNGFVRTGWAGQVGNDALDIDKIAGFGFEFVGFGDNYAAGDITTGALWLDNLSAFYSQEVPGCMDPSSVNYDPEATVDDGSCLYDEDVVYVTFEVNMEMETVSDNGVHLAGGGTFGNPGDNPMYDDGTNGDAVAGDLRYTLTYMLLNNHSTDYTFINGSNTNWSEKEDIAGQDCAVAPYNDRHLDVGVNDTTITTCFAQCTDDGSCGVMDSIDVTFQVNMQDQETDAAGVYIAGGGIGEVGILMDDTDANDIWEVTLTIAADLPYAYKFRNGPGDGNWGGNWEEGDDLAAGGCSYGEYNDRMVMSDVDLTLEAVCFSSCFSCTPIHDVDVVFTVNMNEESGFDPSSESPYVFGSFNNWDYINPVVLTETTAAGIWSSNLTLLSRDTVNYLFGYGAVFEDMADAECSVEDASLSLFVRQAVMPIDTTSYLELAADIFGTCTPTVSINHDALIPETFALDAFPNPFNPDITLNYQIPNYENVKIDVINMRGQQIRSLIEMQHAPGYYSVEWDGRTSYGHQVDTGIYFIVVSRASGLSVTKVTLLK